MLEPKSKMDDFYKQWLKNFAKSRKHYFINTNQSGGSESESEDNSETLTSSSQSMTVPKEPSDIVYENDNYRLIVEKSAFKKQKNFRLQDHLFKFKLVQKDSLLQPPLLTEMFDFLHAALTHILESIKTFYKKEDHNIAYLTLHQDPMINGLNTGMLLLLEKFFWEI